MAAVFAAVILCKNRTVPKVDKKYWGPLILRCVCGTLGILCNFYAIDHLLVADASILNKLSPFFAIIFSFLLLKEKIRPAQAACVALAFIGCLFVVKPGFQNAALVPALIGVESRLYRCKDVQQAIVRAFTDEDGLSYMTAYVVPSDNKLKVSEVKKELSENLTSFMIPEFFVKMKQIPLNVNGKPDVSKLPVVMKAGAL